MNQPNLTDGTLIPAYGRDYSNIKAVERDFRAGKDFKFIHFTGDTYCSIRNAEEGTNLRFRYNKLMKVTFITV